jgi:hypothetical protein
MAAAALKQGFEELMWIDSDMLFAPEDVKRLRSHRTPFVGGIYAKKAARSLACTFLKDDIDVTLGKGGGLREVLFLGTGFLLTHRIVYERIRRRLKLPTCDQGEISGLTSYFGTEYRRQRGEAPMYLSEDYGFCERARKCNFRVLADTTIRLGHIGRRTYWWEDILPQPPRLTTLLVQLKSDRSLIDGMHEPQRKPQRSSKNMALASRPLPYCTEFLVDDMDNDAGPLLTKAIKQVPGVLAVLTLPEAGRLSVRWSGDPPENVMAVIQAAERAGYNVKPSQSK